MNFIQEVLNLLERKQDKKKLDLRRDWFEFGRTRPSSVGNPLYTPKMNPHAIRYDDLKCNIISGLVSGTGTEHTLPMWSVIDKDNCNVQTIIDSIFSQDAGATEGKVSGDFRVTGNTVLEGNLLVLGTQTIVESTIVQVADNIMQINSGGGAFDAGIEVIQPSGTKTWAWDNADGVWSTFDDSILTKDIIIKRAIKQDGKELYNVVNEAEGLASNDNDESYATVAAIIDWTDKMDLDVSADTGIPLDILLNSETLQIRGGSNITTNADGAEKIRIDLDDDITVNSVKSNILTLTGAPGAYSVTSIVNDYNAVVDPNATLLTAKAIIAYVDDQRDYLSNVTLAGTNLNFTGVNNAFSGTIDLSSLLDDTNLARIISGAVAGTDLVLTRDDASDITIDLSSIVNTTPIMSSTITGTGKLWDDTVQVEDAAPVTAVTQRTYGVQFNDAQQLVVNVPWETGSIVLGNPGSPTEDLTSISIDGTVYGIAPGGGGSVTSVGLSTDIAAFQVGNSPITSNGTIELNLSGGTAGQFLRQDGTWADIPSGISYTASNGIELVTPTEFGLINVERTNTSSVASPDHTDEFTVIDNVKTNSKGQITEVNTKTVTLPASGTGADGVITDVSLVGTDLTFTGSNGGFNGVVDLSGYANAPETVTSLSINANVLTYTDENNADTDIDLSLYLDDTNLARLVSGTLDAGTGVATFTRDDATTFTLDLSSLLDTDTNDIDYVSGVALNGSSLDFTGIGNAFAGSIDLSGFSTTDTNTEYGVTLSTHLSGASLSLLGTDGSQDVIRILPGSGIGMSLAADELTISSTVVDTNTTYDLSSRQSVNDVDIALSGSDSSSDQIKLVAGTNVTLTDNGSNQITIDAAGGSDTTVACQSGVGALNSTQSLTSTYASIQDSSASFPLGFKNVSTGGRYYALTWTIEYGMSGTTGFKAFDTEVFVKGTTQLIEYKDSAYMASEYPVSRTYTYTTGLLPDETLEIRVKGDTSLTINKAHLTIIVNDCEANGSGEITILPPSDGGGDRPTVYVATEYGSGTCILSGNTIEVEGNFSIGNIFQYRGKCYEITALSKNLSGITDTVSLFPNCEQCNQFVVGPGK